eukprot:117409_1
MKLNAKLLITQKENRSIFRINRNHCIQHLKPTWLSIYIKNQKLFGCNDYIEIQQIDASVLQDSTNIFYEHLELQRDKIITLQDSNEIDNMYDQEILNAKYVILSDGTGEKEIKSQRMHDSNHYINQFNDIDAFHCIIPYKINVQKTELYVQFSNDLNYVLLKTFNTDSMIDEDTTVNQVNYLQNLLEQYEQPITDWKLFFKMININLQPNHLKIIRGRWDIGSRCQIFSKSAQTWYSGEINNITNTDDGEWLTVRYTVNQILKDTQIKR